jgi:hypothetical protein
MWEYDGDTCKVWMTFLCMKDSDGIVCNNVTGIARICNLPIEKVEEAIERFLSPDPKGMEDSFEGRRIEKLGPGKGWRILNHFKYQALGWSDEKKEMERAKKERYRSKLLIAHPNGTLALPIAKTPDSPPDPKPPEKPRFVKPTREELNLAAAKLGLPSIEVDKFVNHFESNGWRVGGKTPMIKWQSSLANWKINWEERRSKPSGYSSPVVDRNANTFNALRDPDEASQHQKRLQDASIAETERWYEEAELRKTQQPNQTT